MGSCPPVCAYGVSPCSEITDKSQPSSSMTYKIWQQTNDRIGGWVRNIFFQLAFSYWKAQFNSLRTKARALRSLAANISRLFAHSRHARTTEGITRQGGVLFCDVGVWCWLKEQLLSE
uniref:Uncharacterized protein n=1 Tax=Bionectria ochroleuca TaxID=29856 RepID=A0A8H7TSP4_BIOOC